MERSITRTNNMKKKTIKITNSCNGIVYENISEIKNGEKIIKAINENDLQDLLFFELRDYIVKEEVGEYVQVTFEVPCNILNKLVKKIKITKNKIYKEY